MSDTHNRRPTVKTKGVSSLMGREWIPYLKDLPRKPEVGLIRELTGLSRNDVVATLLDFWAWADDNTSDGSLPGFTLQTLKLTLDSTPPAFFDAMVQVGWIVRIEGSEGERTGVQDGMHIPNGLRIPNFDRWMDNSAKDRMLAQRRKRDERRRLEKNGSVTPKRDATVTTIQDNTIQEEKPPIAPLAKISAFVEPFPDLHTEAFARAWADWEGHRFELDSPLTDRARRMGIKKLAEYGHDGAIASIEQSIACGWIGLFPPKTTTRDPAASVGDGGDVRKEWIDRYGTADDEGKPVDDGGAGS